MADDASRRHAARTRLQCRAGGIRPLRLTAHGPAPRHLRLHLRERGTFAVAGLRRVCYLADMKTTLSVAEAQTKLRRLVESKETITLRQREETVVFIVPRERMEALLETMEIMANPAAMRAISRDQSGKGKYLPLSVLDENEG